MLSFSYGKNRTLAKIIGRIGKTTMAAKAPTPVSVHLC